MDEIERIKKEKMREWLEKKNNVQTIINVSDSDFRENVIERSKKIPVVVDFWAPWCMPCTILSPTLENIAKESKGKFVLAEIDVSRNREMAQKYGVMGIPAVKLFKGGKVVNEFVGLQPEQAIREWLDKNIKGMG